MAKKDQPEIAVMKMRANSSLIGDDLKEFLSLVRDMTVIELDGSLGNVSEFLSTTNKSVRLCEEGRLYFVYRRQMWPKSTVVEMNIAPEALNNSRAYYDCVVIHDESKLAIAEKLSKRLIVNVGNLTIIDKDKNDKASEHTAIVDSPFSENPFLEGGIEFSGGVHSDIRDGVFQKADENRAADIPSDPFSFHLG